MLRASPEGRMPAVSAIEALRAAGHRVSRDVLDVLVRGSANSPLEMTEDDVVVLVRGME